MNTKVKTFEREALIRKPARQPGGNMGQLGRELSQATWLSRRALQRGAAQPGRQQIWE